MWADFCGFILKKVMGWTVVGGPVKDKKAILLGVPHTSLWDFVVSYLFYTSLKAGKARIMVKKELFFWPLGAILRHIGAIPVDRTSSSAMVRSLITEVEKADRFILAIAPEGTRKPVKRWKAGYHLIAKATGIPVYMAYFDWGTKRVGIGPQFVLTDDAKADTAALQKAYEAMHLKGKHPEKYITG